MGRAIRGAGTVLGVALLVGGLWACETAGDAADTVSLLWTDPLILKCPDYRILADAANLVKFRQGPGRDLTDVNFESSVVDVKLACTSFVDRETAKGTVEVSVTVHFTAARGPANRDRKARFKYFIRVVGGDGKILYGEDFPLSFGFPGNRTQLRFRGEPVVLEFPVTAKRSTTYFRIFTGFKLSPEELEFNRMKRIGLAR
ncbi:MAG: hypothetical protein IIC56_12250 [Proteobacteria bacterium]|nr:hypothetical protein [Pseudomonadota bacterium]